MQIFQGIFLSFKEISKTLSLNNITFKFVIYISRLPSRKQLEFTPLPQLINR